MKKVLSTVLVLLISTMVFAASEASLQVGTTISPDTGLKISQTEAITNWAIAGITELTTDLTSTAFDGLFVNLRTNKKTSFTINIDAPNLVHEDTAVTYTIGYTVEALTGAGTAQPAITSGTENQPLVVFAGDNGAGMRILSHEFQIDLDDEDYSNAIEGKYSATIVFDIVVGS